MNTERFIWRALIATLLLAPLTAAAHHDSGALHDLAHAMVFSPLLAVVLLAVVGYALYRLVTYLRWREVSRSDE